MIFLGRFNTISIVPLLIDRNCGGYVHLCPAGLFRSRVLYHFLQIEIYALNLLIRFLSLKVDPELEALDGASLPTKAWVEFKPFIRCLPGFKFW
ncbi:hypothetical protein GIB67_014096 [Kingdonia uniflora]|uniref:Uncharacterized protein n=1 Tax=Kingdonia uniflora TaxID=39325 RepID=A0A7J7KXI4_9MAGN|nr:hypothetical protein GIB67_014096 [Kingdonia uniflora]